MPGSESGPALKVRGLYKSYGKTPCLVDVNLTLKRGEVFTYLGPNGAGKTTTIKILCGLMTPDKGAVNVCGRDVLTDPVAVKSRIGVVPDESNLYPELSCQDNLTYLGRLYGLGRDERAARSRELLERFGLAKRAGMPFRALSRGLKRRLVLAAALVHSPEMLFLDEPTNGLDVPGARELRSLIRDVNQQGVTVFLTTHNLAEAEELAHTVCILIKGKVVETGSPEQIRRKVEQGTFLDLSFGGELSADEIPAACPAVLEAKAQNGGWRLKVADLDAALRQCLALAESRGMKLTGVAQSRPNLEEAFLAYLEQDGRQREAAK